MRAFQVSILVAITTLLRGPLMQRASFVQTDVLTIPGNIDMQVTYNVSADWAGRSPDRGLRFMVYLVGFSKVIREFQARSPIQVPSAKCDNCSLTLPASSTSPHYVQLLRRSLNRHMVSAPSAGSSRLGDTTSAQTVLRTSYRAPPFLSPKYPDPLSLTHQEGSQSSH